MRSWTELFFLDEATAFAAGHRPCFYCRRDDANEFRAAWAKGHRSERPSAPEMDIVLHRQRLDGGVKRLHPLPRGKLPTGAMLAAADSFYLIANDRLWRWTESGYLADDANAANARLLTPPAILQVLLAGYRPALHASVA